MRSDVSEPHRFENRLKLPLLGCTEFDKLKAIKASGILEKVRRMRVHGLSPVRINIVSFVTKYAKPAVLSKRGSAWLEMLGTTYLI